MRCLRSQNSSGKWVDIEAQIALGIESLPASPTHSMVSLFLILRSSLPSPGAATLQSTL